jgi:hypothetical protein
VLALAQRFLPAADEVHRLQSGDTAECRVFQAVAEQGHYAGRTEPSSTRQGIYALSPSGRFLASVNSRRPESVAGMLRTALEQWEALPDAERLGGEEAQPAPWRWESEYPEDGLVLRVVSRDLPRPEAERAPERRRVDWREHAWNVDYAWFRAEEARAFLPAEIEAGATVELPARLIERMACLHLVDNVRGQVSHFRRAELERARLSVRVDSVGEGHARLSMRGETRTAVEGTWPVDGFSSRDPGPQRRGIEVELAGRAEWNLAANRFSAFDLVCVGTRWGGTKFNGRADDLDPAPIGFALTLGSGKPAERIAPASIWNYGW